MRSLLFLSAIATAVAGNADCAIDGAKAMDEFSDAAIFIWAATKRCGKAKESQVKCEVDIASAIQSVNNMINVIVNAVGDCNAIKTDHAGCAMAVSELTSAAAGLAASSGEIADACPNTLKNIPAGTAKVPEEQTTLGLCLVDGKSAIGSLFSAGKLLSEVQGDCNGKAQVWCSGKLCSAETRAEWKGKKNSCAYKALDIVSALADMGAFVAASVDDCTSLKGDGDATAACTSGILATVSALKAVATAGMQIDKKCRADNSRLFLEDQEVPATGTSFLTLALAACLPIAAVLSFAVGRRARTNYELAPARELEATF